MSQALVLWLLKGSKAAGCGDVKDPIVVRLSKAPFGRAFHIEDVHLPRGCESGQLDTQSMRFALMPAIWNLTAARAQEFARWMTSFDLVTERFA